VAAERVKRLLIQEEEQQDQILYSARSLLMAAVAVVRIKQFQIIVALTEVLVGAAAY
jgi:hypothetical protein